jgi:hypothetical protein
MPLRSLLPHRLRVPLAILSGVLLAWTAWLFAFGGFDVSIAGIRVRSNNPMRVGWIALAALAAFFIAGGTIPLSRLTSILQRATRAAARRPAWIAIAIAMASTSLAIAGSTRIAGGSDAYGYVSQAELWLRGNLVIEQPWMADVPWPNSRWTFSPLGYRPSEREGSWAIVPTYSPGLPMLLAAAKLAAGHCAMFLVVPLTSGIAVLATFGLGRRLGSAATGAIAAWLVAVSPIVLGSMEPLTDVPVMAAWTAAFYFLLGSTPASAFAAGICAALGTLIRPNLVVLAAPLGVWFLIRRSHETLARRLGAAASYSLGVLAGVAAVAFINQHLYGSMTTSGYGRLEDSFALSRIVPNLRRYLTWLAETQTPIALAGLAATVTPARALWPSTSDRRIFIVIALYLGVLWLQYCAYLEFDSWGYLRFLLPGWPFIMLGTAAILMAVGRLRPLATRWIVAAIVIGLGVWGVYVAERADAFEQRQAARHEAPIGRIVREHTPENSVILADERSGTLRYYAGRATLRYEFLDPAWLDRAVAWMTSRGVRVYAVLDPRQASEFRVRFGRQQTVAALDRALVIYRAANVALFELSPDGVTAPPLTIEQAFADQPGCDPPVPYTPPAWR